MFEIYAPNLNLRRTLESGQVFRYREMPHDVFEIIASGHRCYAGKDGNHIQIEYDARDAAQLSDNPADARQILKDFWTDYFNVRQNPLTLLEMLKYNSFLQDVVEENFGIHILHQDPWECLLWGMLSVRNNIPRIKSSLDALCTAYGECMPGNFYSVPKPAKLARADLTSCKLGFRTSNIKNTAEMIDSRWVRLNNLVDGKATYQQAFQELLRLPGVGPKVANCVCLFGLRHEDAFPVDVHIERMLALPQMEGFDLKQYPTYAGLLQQYLFVYALKHGY